ncbi:MAG TPA: NifU family protein [Pirellulales bacterium]|jgi:Fe-S cluster biogenesis protein NfuA|nr:NifU family protein [Pirellulales bacterium]
MPDDRDFPARMQRIEQAIGEIEATTDPATRARTAELVSLLLELHRGGLERVLELVAQAIATGTSVEERLSLDSLASSLLLLHGLHPVDFPTRVQRALEKVRPMLQSHGGNVELLAIDDRNVRLRLNGSCHGCPSSAQTLKNAIESAICEFAPDVDDLQVEGVVAEPEPAGFVPLELVSIKV